MQSRLKLELAYDKTAQACGSEVLRTHEVDKRKDTRQTSWVGRDWWGIQVA